MKINKKGFMLAEVTVVATLAATVMLAMYASSIKMINAYKERENYYDVDTIYATSYVYNYMIDSGLINTFINDINGSDDTKKYNNKILVINNDIRDILTIDYNINDIRFIKANTNEVDNLNVTNKTFKNYLNNYVKNNVSGDNDKYILIIERVVNNEYYYYSVEV